MSAVLTESVINPVSIPLSKGPTTGIANGKKGRKTKVASLPAAAIKTEQPEAIAVKEEEGLPGPVVQFETSGLSTAVALTGSKKRARAKKHVAASGTDNGPVTPELIKTASQPVAGADSPQLNGDDPRAALASALREAVARRAAPAPAPARGGRGRKQQDTVATATDAADAAGSMPPIPAAAEAVKLRKQAKSAAAAAAAIELPATATEAAPAPAKPKKRAKSAAAATAGSAAEEMPAAEAAPKPAKLMKHAKSAAAAVVEEPPAADAAHAPLKRRGRAKAKADAQMPGATSEELVEQQVFELNILALPNHGHIAC